MPDIDKNKNNQPIGVFDSGIGGLTVVKEIIKTLPNESIIYLGDTARVPYGTRNKDTINKFALELTKFLLKQKVKALVVACNTMSAVSLSEIKRVAGGIPVIDVISPTVSFAVSTTQANVLGVVGTRATMNSRAYQLQLKKKNKAIKILGVACPLFVPLIEEGLIKDVSTKLIAREYLSVFNKSEIDTLILGCTHYPLLRNLIAEILGNKVLLINSAKPTSNELKRVLKEKNILSNKKPSYRFYVTDVYPKMQEMVDLIFDNKFPGELKNVSIFK
ncbi:MAG: glutamate racemase, partial [Patescibacteria group bacterium]